MLKKCNTKNVFPYWRRRKAHARPQCWDMGTCCFTWVAASCFLVSRNELRCAVRMHGCLSVHVWETQRSREEEGDCNWVESGHLLSSHWRGTRFSRGLDPHGPIKNQAQTSFLSQSSNQAEGHQLLVSQLTNHSFFLIFRLKYALFVNLSMEGKHSTCI